MLFQQVTAILFCYHEDVPGAVLQPGDEQPRRPASWSRRALTTRPLSLPSCFVASQWGCSEMALQLLFGAKSVQRPRLPAWGKERTKICVSMDKLYLSTQGTAHSSEKKMICSDV